MLEIFKKMFFILKLELHTERDWGKKQKCWEILRETIYLPSSASLLDGHHSQCYARLKPGAKRAFQVSHMSSGAEAFGPPFLAFPVPFQELD